MDETLQYLYRGTSTDFPGSAAFQKLRRTSTSSDPLVATLFGIHCSSRHGDGILHIAPRAKLVEYIVPPNVLSDLEDEVALEMLPVELVQYVERTITAQEARKVLSEMGFQVPVTIAGS